MKRTILPDLIGITLFLVPWALLLWQALNH